MKIAVIGAGSWGTALARLVAINGNDTCVWSIDAKEVEILNTYHEQTEKLPGVKLPDNVSFTTELNEAVSQAEICVMAVPSPFVRETSSKLKSIITDGQIIVNVAKGIETGTLMTMSQIIESEIPQAEVAVLSGPSHAEEVGKDVPTLVVVSAEKQETAEKVRSVFMNHAFRVYLNPDTLGVELGAALKNVIALAAGVADGLGCGDNTKAALITRGIAEMKRLGEAMGAKSETFSGLSGTGDLIVTCSSMHSRNRRAGILMGQGKTMQEAMDEVKMVVEGVHSAKAAMELAKKYDVNAPLIEEMYKLLFEDKSAKECLESLMSRDKQVEYYGMEWSL